MQPDACPDTVIFVTESDYKSIIQRFASETMAIDGCLDPRVPFTAGGFQVHA